jgi:hypothetical protein
MPMDLFQVVLFSQAAPAEAPANIRHVRLQQARARDVAGVLSLLILPTGPSGTDNRYTLVYPSRLEQDAAAQAAVLFDVPAASTTAPADDMAATWQWGIAEFFRIAEEPGAAPERIRPLAERLNAAASSARLSTVQRWAAAMLAGELFAHRLYDFVTAADAFVRAEAAAEPGTYQQMAVLYARGRALQQDGKRGPARAIFETILAQFGAMRNSEVFERTRETLAEWDRRPK